MGGRLLLFRCSVCLASRRSETRRALSLPSVLDASVIHYLAYLPPRCVTAWTEGHSVSADDAPVIGCFHECIEGVGCRHVYEVRSSGGVYCPPFGQHRYLAQL